VSADNVKLGHELSEAVAALLINLPIKAASFIVTIYGDVIEPRLPTVETIARLALSACRNRQEFRLEHAGPDLLDLLALCGLAMPVRGAADAGVAPDHGLAGGVSRRGGPAARRAGRIARCRGRT